MGGEACLDLLVGGDVFVNRGRPSSAFSDLAGVLTAAEVRVCNLEAPLTNRGAPYLGKRIRLRSDPVNVEALVGMFDAVSLSNNHMLDYGVEGMADTLSGLAAHGIACTGAGESWETSTRPVVTSHGGLRVGFVAYSMVAPEPYAAGTDRAGISLLRVETTYAPMVDLLLEQPGTPPRVGTRLLAADAVRLRRELAGARTLCDFLVVSFHWGIAFTTALADYQREAAQLAVEAGAGLVVGHHPHVVQGFEIRQGVPVFYSLGNLVFDYDDARMSPYGLIAHCALVDGKVAEVGTIATCLGVGRATKSLPFDAGQAMLATAEGGPWPDLRPSRLRDGIRLWAPQEAN